MRSNSVYIWAAGIFALFLLTRSGNEKILKLLLHKFEGFRANPYWDVSRWSWGYGTRVPGSIDNPNIRPSGTITQSQAMNDALEHARRDRTYLEPLLSVNLSPFQWAALLSFSYNLGPGSADNLITNINSGNYPALEQQWKSYIYSDGVKNDDLEARRNAEWELFVAG